MNLVLLETIRITFITLFNWPEDILEATLFCTQFYLLILLAIQISAVCFSAFAVMSILYGFRSYDIAIIGVIRCMMIEVWCNSIEAAKVHQCRYEKDVCHACGLCPYEILQVFTAQILSIPLCQCVGLIVGML